MESASGNEGKTIHRGGCPVQRWAAFWDSAGKAVGKRMGHVLRIRRYRVGDNKQSRQDAPPSIHQTPRPKGPLLVRRQGAVSVRLRIQTRFHCRVLETLAQGGGIKASKGWTDLFIHPPYKFKMVNTLLTNFHLPKTTLLVLVATFAGRTKILDAYE